jgi:soluble lytic murein transglycosylase-like protein
MTVLAQSRPRLTRIGPALTALLVGTIFVPSLVVAQSPPPPVAATAAHDIERHITDAAQRFGLPPHWIRAVIAVESGGDPRAVSRAGAMGLMQIMPETWAALRASHGLGPDPFAPRDNLLAGAAYLRSLHDCFGAPGFLAAYNAGPARYLEHVATGRPLPRETRDYVATLAPMLGMASAVPAQPGARPALTDWRNAPLFIDPSSEAGSDGGDADGPAAAAAGEQLFVPPGSRRSP